MLGVLRDAGLSEPTVDALRRWNRLEPLSSLGDVVAVASLAVPGLGPTAGAWLEAASSVAPREEALRHLALCPSSTVKQIVGELKTVDAALNDLGSTPGRVIDFANAGPMPIWADASIVRCGAQASPLIAASCIPSLR